MSLEIFQAGSLLIISNFLTVTTVPHILRNLKIVGYHARYMECWLVQQYNLYLQQLFEVYYQYLKKKNLQDSNKERGTTQILRTVTMPTVLCGSDS
jgi:hypothetical protein